MSIVIINEPERSKLYKRIRNLLGAPLRGVELDDEMMDSLLELSIEDYEQHVQDWLIESQWTSVYGLNLDEQSITRALSTRSMDWETQYTYAYSKIVGLQAGGDWVLGFSQMGTTGNYFITPAFDILLRMSDIQMKRRIITGDLTYRVTALPEGKKAIHLMNVPGGKFDFGNMRRNDYRVWYWYYDTFDREDCLSKNPDVVRLPSDIPLDKLRWDRLNSPAQTWVRRWFTAYCKETLGRVRGKFSGNLKTPDSELTLEYQSLQTEAKDEKTMLWEELKTRLERLRPEKMMEQKALQAENLNKLLKFRAFTSPYTVI